LSELFVFFLGLKKNPKQWEKAIFGGKKHNFFKILVKINCKTFACEHQQD